MQEYGQIPAKRSLALAQRPYGRRACASRLVVVHYQQDPHPARFRFRVYATTLVIHGDTDPIPVQTAETIHKSISGSRLVVLEQCGHFPYVESPEKYFSQINACLNDGK